MTAATQIPEETLRENTYIDDELIFYSFTFSLVSIFSFYPIIFLLNK